MPRRRKPLGLRRGAGGVAESERPLAPVAPDQQDRRRPPAAAPAPPDQQDRRATARQEHVQRGAAPTGGPGRASRRKAERVVRRVERGRASTAEIQRHLRREGFDVAVDDDWGSQTQSAWDKYRQTLLRGHQENIFERQRQYLQTALTASPDWETERELFGDEGVRQLELARKRFRGYQHQLRMQELNQPESEGLLGRLGGIAGDVARFPIENVRSGGLPIFPGDRSPRDDALAAREAVGGAIDKLTSPETIWNLEKFTAGHLLEMVRRDPSGFAANPMLAFTKTRQGQESLFGPETAAATHGEDYDKRWLALEMALIPFRPLAILRSVLPGVRTGLRAGPRAALAASQTEYAAPGRVRTYVVGKHEARREGSRSRTGGAVEALADRLKNTEKAAGREVRYSTKFRLDLLQVPADTLRRIGRRLRDEEEYALRIVSEGRLPAERQAHHVELARKGRVPEETFYHLAHAGWNEKASPYVMLNPAWREGVDVQEVPRVILRADAPRRLHDAWEWFQRNGELREQLLEELGRLSDARIMYRLHAPGRVMSGARWKKFERKIAEDLEADPARQQAFEWVEQNIEDPMEAAGLRALYDHVIRSAADETGKPVSEILSRIKGVEQVDEIPGGSLMQTQPLPERLRSAARLIESMELADNFLTMANAVQRQTIDLPGLREWLRFQMADASEADSRVLLALRRGLEGEPSMYDEIVAREARQIPDVVPKDWERRAAKSTEEWLGLYDAASTKAIDRLRLGAPLYTAKMGLRDDLVEGGWTEAEADALASKWYENIKELRRQKREEAGWPEGDVGQVPGLQRDTEHSAWDIITKIVDEPEFERFALERPIDDIAHAIERGEFLVARRDIRALLESADQMNPDLRGHFERLLDNVNQLQRQKAEGAIAEPHVEPPTPVIGRQLFHAKTDPEIFGAYMRGKRISEERGLEDAINAAVKADDLETAQVLKNMLTGQGKQIPGVERRTTEGELFQRREPQEGWDFGRYRKLNPDVVEDALGFEQRGGNLERISRYGIKGAVQFDQKDFARILLTDASDVTTLPHEIAHVMRRLMTPRQEKKIARWAGADLTGPKDNRRYVWDEAAEEKFASAVEKVIRRGVEPTGAKREFRALAKAFREVWDEAELPDVPQHVDNAIRKLFDYEKRPGGTIMGAEDVLHGVEYAPTWRGMPFKITQPQRAMAAYVRRGLGLFGGGRKRAIGGGPDDEALKKSYEGAALISGFFTKDVIGPKADSLVLASRLSAAGVARAALLKAGEPIPKFADDIAVVVDPKLHTKAAEKGRADLQRLHDKMAQLGERKLSEKDLDGVNWDLIETARQMVLPPEIDGRKIRDIAEEIIDTERPIENYVWVPKEFVDASGLLYVPRASTYQETALKKWMHRGGLSWDVVNDLVKAQILWLNPAYAPVQFIGNTVMNLMHQGPFAMVSGYKSVLMFRQMELAERLAVDRAMGEGIGGAIAPRGWESLEALRHYNSVVADVFPRRMAFMHEARRDGLKSVQDVNALMRAVNAGDQQALERVEMIARRARRSIVDFDRLSPFERDVVTRWIFFYPWLRGATDYSINFIKDHPIQAAAIALMYEHFKAAQQDILGDHPHYAALDVPISTDTIGLKIPLTDKDISLSDATGEHTWRDDKGNPMVFKLRQALTQTTPLELGTALGAFALAPSREEAADVAQHLTPVPYAAGVSIFGYDPYERKEVNPGFLTFLNQVSPGQAPLTDRIKQLFFTSDEERAEANERALYPRERRHHAARLALGSLAPTPYNVEIGQERARKTKDTLSRKTEELQIDGRKYGLGDPPSDVLEDLNWNIELYKGWRGLSPKKKAERSATLHDRRYGGNERAVVPSLVTQRDYEEFYRRLNRDLYPALARWESDLEQLEDEYIEAVG